MENEEHIQPRERVILIEVKIQHLIFSSEGGVPYQNVTVLEVFIPETPIDPLHEKLSEMKNPAFHQRTSLKTSSLMMRGLSSGPLMYGS
ncbi:MAG: hypothetical protein R3330_14220, partial [Saprospiraceae bacterium]|nr:hypothetical protein [Saprospiraceae bacterium]